VVVLLYLSAFFGYLQGGNLYKYVIVLLRLSAFFGHLHGGHISIKMVEEMQKHVAGTLKTEIQTSPKRWIQTTIFVWLDVLDNFITIRKNHPLNVHNWSLQSYFLISEQKFTPLFAPKI